MFGYHRKGTVGQKLWAQCPDLGKRGQCRCLEGAVGLGGGAEQGALLGVGSNPGSILRPGSLPALALCACP